MGKSLGRECNFGKVCFELGTEYWSMETSYGYKDRVNSQSRGPMTEKALLPSDDRT